jgi:hypothetical protein
MKIGFINKLKLNYNHSERVAGACKHLIVLEFFPFLVLLLDQFLKTSAILRDNKGVAVSPTPHQLVVDHKAAADDWSTIAIKLQILFVIEPLVDLLSGNRENHTLLIFHEISAVLPIH